MKRLTYGIQKWTIFEIIVADSEIIFMIYTHL